MRRIQKFVLLNAVLLAAILFPAYQNGDRIRYFNSQTIQLKPDTVQAFVSNFKDDAGNDTLFQIRSKEGYPVLYFRKIKTSVCFDNKCRLLDIVLFWNVTGRYLGYELRKVNF
jgi:hypothetical protein